MSTVFFTALGGLACLFALKNIEVRRGRIFLPRVRAVLDRGALVLKALLIRFEILLISIPPLVAMLARLFFAAAARAFARAAHRVAEGSHEMADFVSHKRNFERRPPRSEFLRKIEEHKNGAQRAQKDASRGVEIDG